MAVFNKEHPRVCGENTSRAACQMAHRGTSPRMRGKRHNQPGVAGTVRNIPAYAGKTLATVGNKRGPQEHPRVCGENSPARMGFACTTGTSPRMRGKPLILIAPNSGTRNIPAYAGKTTATSRPHGLYGEHPRVCGENDWDIDLRGFREGTSPRMRGKPQQHPGPTAYTGNIPAYAGKTRGIRWSAVSAPEHPRVCGENTQQNKFSSARMGTSPRMRGKPKIRC